MKQTRKIFVLNGYTPEQEAILLESLNFKALTVFHRKNISSEELFDVFYYNKSALCISCTMPETFYENAIKCNNLNLGSNVISQFQEFAELSNCDIGDHKSNSSGLTGIPTSDDCGYCKYMKGLPGNYGHTTLYSSANFIVFCTLGQFINGYLLIIPYSHIMSNAELNEDVRFEFLTVLEDVTYIIKLTYNVPNVLVWENGTGNSGIGKAKNSIVHAHTHVAPSNLTAKTIEQNSGFPFKNITFEEISEFSDDSYLLIKDDDTNWKICQESNLYIPRQYVRQLIAEEYEIPGEAWNWRTHPFKDKMKETDNQIKATLIEHWDFLPITIRARTKKYLF